MRSVEGSIYRHDDGRRWFARLQYTDAAGRRREKKRICRTHELAKRNSASFAARSPMPDLAVRLTASSILTIEKPLFTKPVLSAAKS
jgi:hypothetical protein